jgi:hypothetical protein
LVLVDTATTLVEEQLLPLFLRILFVVLSSLVVRANSALPKSSSEELSCEELVSTVEFPNFSPLVLPGTNRRCLVEVRASR